MKAVTLGWLTDWLTNPLHSQSHPSLSHILQSSLSRNWGNSVRFLSGIQGVRFVGLSVCSTHFSCFVFTRMEMEMAMGMEPLPAATHISTHEYIFISEMWACSSFKSKCVVYQGSSINWLFITIYYIYALRIVSANIVSLSTLPRNLLKSHLHLITLQTYSTCIIINNTCRIV